MIPPTSKGLIARDNFQCNQSVESLQAPHGGFRDAMFSAGLLSDVQVIPDGKIHRFKADGDKRPNAWYVSYGDGGAFGNWRTGVRETWFRGDLSNHRRRVIRKEIVATQRAARKELDRKHQRAREIAVRRWNAASPATIHPYLDAKGVGSHGLKVEDGNLLAPVCHNRRIWSLQIITAGGDKRFLSGGRISGGYFSIGSPDGRIWIAEGYATAATVYEVTGDAVVCAFNAGNLVKVARHIRDRFTDHEIYVAADNDEAGIKAAMEAMRQHALEGYMWPDMVKADWNDYCAVHGPGRTRMALMTIESEQ